MSELGLGLRESSRIKTLYIVRGNWASGQSGIRFSIFRLKTPKKKICFEA